MFPVFRKIRDAAEKEKVIEAAKADNHNFRFPTHVILRDKEIIGAASLGLVPLVLHWSDSKKLHPKDSLFIPRVVDSVMETMGHTAYWVACRQASPYFHCMEKLGYKKTWDDAGIFLSGTFEK